MYWLVSIASEVFHSNHLWRFESSFVDYLIMVPIHGLGGYISVSVTYPVTHTWGSHWGFTHTHTHLYWVHMLKWRWYIHVHFLLMPYLISTRHSALPDLGCISKGNPLMPVVSLVELFRMWTVQPQLWCATGCLLVPDDLLHTETYYTHDKVSLSVCVSCV